MPLRNGLECQVQVPLAPDPLLSVSFRAASRQAALSPTPKSKPSKIKRHAPQLAIHHNSPKRNCTFNPLAATLLEQRHRAGLSMRIPLSSTAEALGHPLLCPRASPSRQFGMSPSCAESRRFALPTNIITPFQMDSTNNEIPFARGDWRGRKRSSAHDFFLSSSGVCATVRSTGMEKV